MGDHLHSTATSNDDAEQSTPPQYSRPLPPLENSNDCFSFSPIPAHVAGGSGRPPSWLANLPPGPKETPTQSIRKKHRSVRSLTREYETSGSTPSSSSSTTATTPSPGTTATAHQRPHDPFNSRPNTLPPKQQQRAIDRVTAQSSTSSPTPAPLSARSSNSLVAMAQQHSHDDHVHHAHHQHHHEHAGLPTLSVSLDDDKSGNSNIGSTLSRSRSHHERTPSSSFDVEPSQDEENDSLGELHRSQSMTTGSPARKALSQMTAAERREHSRKHSRVHSRNLSVFFPQPGTDAEVEQDRFKVGMQFGSNNGENRPPQTISVDTSSGGLAPSFDAAFSPSPTKSRRGHHTKHSVSYQDHMLSPGGMTRDSSNESLAWSETLSRNGSRVSSAAHQHAHENSHAGHSHAHAHDHAHQHHDHGHGHSHEHHSHGHAHAHAHAHVADAMSSKATSGFLPSLPPLPPSLAPNLFYSLAHFLLGSSLWASGQSTDLLSVTGMGYLVVFDSLGSFNEVLARWVASAKQQSRSVNGKDRHRVAEAYATQRVGTLLNFVQTIYLLFAAVYVCKESIEHVLLEGGSAGEGEIAVGSAASDAAAAGVEGGSLNVAMGGGAGHHHHDGLINTPEQLASLSAMGTQLPTILLILATLACLFANLFMANHASLVAASGLSTTSSPSSGASRRRHGRSQSVLVSTGQRAAGPLLSLLSNPFSLTVLFFSSSLLFAALTMSPLQVQALDKVLAGLESVAMWYIALPASKVLGKVLLQTAPSVSADDEGKGGRAQLVQLMRATKALEEEQLIEHIAPPNVWQLTPSTAASQTMSKSSGADTLAGTQSSATRRAARSPSLIATVRILLRDEAKDEDVLRITRWAYERLAPAVGAGMGVNAGQALRGSLSAGELVVDVRRKGVAAELAHAHHHDHGHDHGHDRDHAHDHGHDHGHGHEHHHHHHHGHDHAHAHGGCEGHDQHHHDHHHHEHGHTHARAHTHNHAPVAQHVHSHDAHDHGHQHSHDHDHHHHHHHHH